MPSNNRTTMLYSGRHCRATRCPYCGINVDTALHYELDGSCPKRIVYGEAPTKPDDPTFAGVESYKLRRIIR